MQLKLTRLVLITCIALVGIIALQVFWLYKAYQEQKMQLLTLADNTLMETQIFTGVNATLRHTAQSLVSDILVDVSKGNINLNDTDHIAIQKRYELHSVELPKDDSGMKTELLKLIGLDTTSRKAYTLEEYKRIIAKSLVYKKADMPFELALIDVNDSIIQCTGDITAFKKAGVVTGTQYSLPITLNSGLTGRARLAFPNAVFYLLKGMWVILLLSLCLIFICAFSFSYMVALFYKQKRVAEIKNDFMNNMTHELKTPISSVSVALELLQDTSVTMKKEEKEEYFHIAGNELKRLTLLVDKVLRMAAFEKMEVNIKRERIKGYEWIQEVVHSMKPLTDTERAVIDISVDPLALTLFADRSHMTSVLQNLLENAIKYADRNKAILHIVILLTEDRQFYYLKVTDNGKGIDHHHQSKVFDKFFRVPTGDEHDIKGYGLGLSYVKEIVRLHDGSVQLESELKAGTTFTIIIPKQD